MKFLQNCKRERQNIKKDIMSRFDEKLRYNNHSVLNHVLTMKKCQRNIVLLISALTFWFVIYFLIEFFHWDAEFVSSVEKSIVLFLYLPATIIFVEKYSIILSQITNFAWICVDVYSVEYSNISFFNCSHFYFNSLLCTAKYRCNYCLCCNKSVSSNMGLSHLFQCFEFTLLNSQSFGAYFLYLFELGALVHVQ